MSIYDRHSTFDPDPEEAVLKRKFNKFWVKLRALFRPFLKRDSAQKKKQPSGDFSNNTDRYYSDPQLRLSAYVHPDAPGMPETRLCRAIINRHYPAALNRPVKTEIYSMTFYLQVPADDSFPEQAKVSLLELYLDEMGQQKVFMDLTSPTWEADTLERVKQLLAAMTL